VHARGHLVPSWAAGAGRGQGRPQWPTPDPRHPVVSLPPQPPAATINASYPPPAFSHSRTNHFFAICSLCKLIALLVAGNHRTSPQISEALLLLMAKPSVAVPEVGVPAAQASCTCPGTLLAYPPPRGAGVAAAVRRTCLQVELGAGAGLLGGAGAWGVESMRASSPTHARAAAALAAGGGVDVDVDEERAASWMARHPSALGRFERIVAAAEGKRIVMFLDYDGTLSPIVDDPDAAFMSETVSELR
jgi:hypothetical protein